MIRIQDIKNSNTADGAYHLCNKTLPRRIVPTWIDYTIHVKRKSYKTELNWLQKQQL